jgi:hypothetical protein
VDGQSLEETCGALPTTCTTLTGNYAAMLGSCSAVVTKSTSKPCKVGAFTSNKMCPLGVADSKPSASNKGNVWAGTFLPQPSGSCTVMACNVDAGSSCFPLSLDLLKPPATSKTSNAAVAATVTVSCINGELVGDFKAADGYSLANARVQSTCGQTRKDTPKYCPSRTASLSATAQDINLSAIGTAAARVVSHVKTVISICYSLVHQAVCCNACWSPGAIYPRVISNPFHSNSMLLYVLRCLASAS